MELSPVVLRDDGLAEILAWLASHMEEQYGLQVRLEAKENYNQLEDHVRVVLFQAVRELLFNIVKHAGTSYAEVTLAKVDGHGHITIRDSGKGFDAGAVMANPKTAHGLLLIQNRLGLIGADMKVTSSPGEGTYVEIDVPIGGKPT
jgi:two-component system CheB/CheR fusion protein